MLEFNAKPFATSAITPAVSFPPEKPAIPTRRIDVLVKLFYVYAHFMMRKQFFSIRVKNVETLRLRPDVATLCISNHCNWWDGLTDFILVSRLAPRARFFVMIEELRRFPILSYLGGFSIEKNSAATALRALQYAAHLLEANPNNLLWIYPQGKVLPQEHRPLDFNHGVAYLAQKLPHLNILPVAQYYSFHREDRPEIFLQVGEPITVSSELARDRKALSLLFEEKVTGLLDAIGHDLANAHLDSYSTILQGSPNPFKSVEEELSRARSFLEACAHPSQLLKLLFSAEGRP